MSYFKHESAYVDEGVVIGEGTKIWHFCHLQSGARIGANCILGQNVNIAGDVVIGNGVKIQNNVTVYTGAQIDDYCFLGPSCVFTNVTNPRSEINRHSLYEKTRLKRGVTLGANCTIVCGTTLGRYSLVAAGAVVTKDVPDYALMMGVPARQTAWVSRHGHILAKVGALDGIYTCPESGLRYELKAGTLRCFDLDEDALLPETMRQGVKTYDELKGVQEFCKWHS